MRMDKLNESMLLSYDLASGKDFEAIYDLYMDRASNPFLTYDIMDRLSFKMIYDELLSTRTLYIVSFNNEIAGSYRLIRKTHRQAGTAYIGGFVVKDSFKGKGLGTKILLHIKNESLINGIKRLELTVDLQNESAINLYKKVGFEIEGIVRMSYKIIPSDKYFDEYLMSLIL